MEQAAELKVLFISRAYPPTIGGIEKHNAEIAQALSKIANVSLIANYRGKKFLPLFLPIALIKALMQLHRVDVVLLGDGVLAVLGYFIKKFTSIPVVSVVHGLDLTFSSKIYQHFWIKRFLPALDSYIAVGNETIRQGVQRGLPQSKFVFIGNGVNAEVDTHSYSHHDLEVLAQQALPKHVLLTLGRQVKRKGVAWFVNEVMPILPADVCYLIAGDGKEMSAIKNAIINKNLASRVICLGQVSEKQKQILLSAADIFIQPNIAVEGDMEGFGIVVLEAAILGCFVVASDIEGLKDAICHGKNGLLIPSQDALAYQSALLHLLGDKAALHKRALAAKQYVQTQCTWSSVAATYLLVLQSVLKLSNKHK